jgi:predicted DNA-binding transcriptional regulator AlpA
MMKAANENRLPTKLISLESLDEAYGIKLSRYELLLLEEKRQFPIRVMMGRKPMWVVAEIEDWLHGIASKRDDPPPLPAECKVYFISDGAAIKIGSSMKPSKRRKELQTAHHTRLEILGQMPGDLVVERQTQRLFQSDAINGEWFKDTPKLRKFIQKNCEAA